MKKEYTSVGLSFRIWALTSITASAGIAVFLSLTESYWGVGGFIFIFLAGFVLSVPALTVLFITIPLINALSRNWKRKFYLLILVLLGTTFGYGLIFGLLTASVRIWNDEGLRFVSTTFAATGLLFGSTVVASFLLLKMIASFFIVPNKGLLLLYFTKLNLSFYIKKYNNGNI